MAALAGIGSLPDTITDRAVVVAMRRLAPGETVARYRDRRDGEPLRDHYLQRTVTGHQSAALAACSRSPAGRRSWPWPPARTLHDYLDERTGVLAAMLAKRAPGYTGVGFSDPRRLALTPSTSMES